MDSEREPPGLGEPRSKDRRRLLQRTLVGATIGIVLGASGCSIFDRPELKTKNADDFIIHDNTNWES